MAQLFADSFGSSTVKINHPVQIMSMTFLMEQHTKRIKTDTCMCPFFYLIRFNYKSLLGRLYLAAAADFLTADSLSLEDCTSSLECE